MSCNCNTVQYNSGNKSYNYTDYANFLMGKTQIKETQTMNLPYPFQKPMDIAPSPFTYTIIDGNKVTAYQIRY